MALPLPAWRSLALTLALPCIIALPAFGQGVTVGTGTQFSLGGGSLSAGCGDLTVRGQFNLGSGSANTITNVSINPGTIDGGSGSIGLSGNWSNAGTFIPGSSTVALNEDCGTGDSVISGDTQFSGLSATTASGKRVRFDSASAQTVTSSLSLTGTAADRLRVESTSPGTQAVLTLQSGASQVIDGVRVQDMDSSAGETIAPNLPGVFDSVDAGNNSNWFVAVMQQIREIPVLPAYLLALLAALVLGLGSRAAARRGRG